MDERRLEMKVGVLILATLAAGMALLSLMGELSLGRKRALSVEFGHTGNVVKGAPVKLGGVTVGRVEEILLTPDHRDPRGEPLPVRMDLSVEPDALSALRKDAVITVATLGPLGEPYLELYPGSARAAPLPPKSTLRGVDAPRLDLVANRLSGFLESASRVLEEDPQAIKSLVEGVSELSGTVSDVLKENRLEIRNLAHELSAAAKDMRVLSELARRNLEPGGKGARLLDDASESARLLRGELPGLSEKAGRALGGLAAVSGQLTAEDGARLKVAIDRYASAGERLDKLAERGERILARMEAGQGSMGAMYKDPQLYDDLKAMVSDLRKHPWKMLWKD